jgi:mannitol-specific phosphotransferase system IIBC component
MVIIHVPKPTVEEPEEVLEEEEENIIQEELAEDNNITEEKIVEEDAFVEEPEEVLEEEVEDDFVSKLSKAFDKTKGVSKDKWADSMREKLKEEGLKPLSVEEHIELVKDKEIVIVEQQREICDKIMKVSAQTIQRIKDLRITPFEPLGDVVRRLAEKEKLSKQ